MGCGPICTEIIFYRPQQQPSPGGGGGGGCLPRGCLHGGVSAQVECLPKGCLPVGGGLYPSMH